MRKFTLLFVLCACLIGWCVTGNALAQTPTTVVVGFEEAAPLDGYEDYSTRPSTNSYWAYGFPPNDDCDNIEAGEDEWGDDIYIVTYSSHNTEFKIHYGDYYNYNEEYVGSFWGGIGLSTKSTKTADTPWYDDGTGDYDGNDLLSVTGSGYNSLTYGVAFGSAWAQSWYFDEYLPSIKLPENALLQSIRIANTKWTVEYLQASTLEDIYLDLIIYGIGKDEFDDDELKTYQTVHLSNLAGWTQISFGAGWEDVTELRFAFDSNDYDEWGLLPPVYFAFDDLTYELDDDDDEIESP
jgi:hypothetical protein